MVMTGAGMSKAVVLPLRVHQGVYTLTRDTALTDARSLAFVDVMSGIRFVAFAGQDGYPKLDLATLAENLERISMNLDRAASHTAHARYGERADSDVQWCLPTVVEEEVIHWASYRRKEDVAAFPAISDPVKFERMLKGEWRYNDWVHLSLADFMPADAGKGAARFPSEAAGTATDGFSQLALLATQLEGLARVYTVLFGSTFERVTETIVSDLRDRHPRYTDVSMDYLNARLHEQMAGAHWDLARQRVSKAFGTPIGSPADAARLLQQYLAAADLRPELEQLFLRKSFPKIVRGSRGAGGPTALGTGPKRPRQPSSPRPQQQKRAKTVSFSSAASDSSDASGSRDSAPAKKPTPRARQPTPPTPRVASARPAGPAQPTQRGAQERAKSFDGMCLFAAAHAAGLTSPTGARITCHSPPGSPCPNGSHTALTGPRAVAFGRGLAAAGASGQKFHLSDDLRNRIVRHCAPNAR
jgi:hypothetical protein